jgi:hypothetical protein
MSASSGMSRAQPQAEALNCFNDLLNRLPFLLRCCTRCDVGTDVGCWERVQPEDVA